MREKLFPKEYFPTTISVIYWMLMSLSAFILITTILFLPARATALGEEFTQIKWLNSLLFASFILGMAGYTIERK